MNPYDAPHAPALPEAQPNSHFKYIEYGLARKRLLVMGLMMGFLGWVNYNIDSTPHRDFLPKHGAGLIWFGIGLLYLYQYFRMPRANYRQSLKWALVASGEALRAGTAMLKTKPGWKTGQLIITAKEMVFTAGEFEERYPLEEVANTVEARTSMRSLYFYTRDGRQVQFAGLTGKRWRDAIRDIERMEAAA